MPHEQGGRVGGQLGQVQMGQVQGGQAAGAVYSRIAINKWMHAVYSNA